jgi:hypothetical protein
MFQVSFRRIVVLLGVFTVFLLLGGCGSASTQYYFAAADLNAPGDDPELTFYRVTFDANSFLEKATLTQGFYDAEALHQLFGEVKKPSEGESAADPENAADNGTETVKSGEYTLQFDPKLGTWRVVDHRDRFTIVYGANADKMAKQVQAFADSDEIGTQLGQIFKQNLKEPEKKPAGTTARKRLAAAQAGAAVAATELAAAAEGLSDASTSPETRAALVAAADAVLKSLNSREKDLDDQDPDKAMEAAQKRYDRLSKSN